MKSACAEYSILLFEEKDAKDLASLEARCFSLPWSEEQYRVILRAGSGPGFLQPAPVFGIRSADDQIAAYLSLGLHHAAAELEVYNIAVRPDLRGQGFAHALLAFALREAAQHGFTRAILEVRPSNTPALALYERLGFTLCGRRKKYYTDTGEDALVLEHSIL